MDATDSRPPGLRPVPRRPWIVLGWLATLLLPALVLAQTSGVDVRTATAELRDGVWYLTGRIEYRLSRQVLDALQNGVPLSFELEVQVARERRWLPNATVATLRQESELSWQPLAQSYLVRNLNSGDQQVHGTLFGALRDLGRISDLPLIDDALLEPDSRHQISVRARLDQNKLPGPLRLLAFWDDSLSLESEWYRWRLGT